MIRVRRAVAGVTTAVIVYAALVVATFVIGGADCHSGECNVVGEAASDEPWSWPLWATYLAIAASLGVVVARAVR